MLFADIDGCERVRPGARHRQGCAPPSKRNALSPPVLHLSECSPHSCFRTICFIWVTGAMRSRTAADFRNEERLSVGHGWATGPGVRTGHSCSQNLQPKMCSHLSRLQPARLIH